MHQNRSHHHHGTAEGSFTAKKWFGHRAGRSPCAHSIGKFFLCYIVLFSSETSAPGSPGNYLYEKLSEIGFIHLRMLLLKMVSFLMTGVPGTMWTMGCASFDCSQNGRTASPSKSSGCLSKASKKACRGISRQLQYVVASTVASARLTWRAKTREFSEECGKNKEH